jgi:hypothetical protein
VSRSPRRILPTQAAGLVGTQLPNHPGLIADFDNGDYFATSTARS